MSLCNELDTDLHQLITWPRVKISSEWQQIKFWTRPINRLSKAQAHIYVINSLTVLRRILLNPERSGAEVVAFPCQVGVYEPGSTRSVSGAHKHNLAAVMWNYWACLVPTCVTHNCKKEKKFNSLATKECLYLITLTANLMVVNQWHVIQAEQPNGFIDGWHLKLLENWCSCYIQQAGTEPYQTVALLPRANFCFSWQCFKSWVTSNLHWTNRPVCELQAQSCTVQKRSPEVDTSKCHVAGTGSEFQRKAGTLPEPVRCSYHSSATGTKSTMNKKSPGLQLEA